MNTTLIILIVAMALPFVLSFFQFLFGQFIPRRLAWISPLTIGVSLAISLALLVQSLRAYPQGMKPLTWDYLWLQVGGANFSLSFGLYVDTLSLILFAAILLGSWAIHLYFWLDLPHELEKESLSEKERSFYSARFFGQTSLLTGAAGALILVSNLFFFFFFWSLLTFASFSLISFYSFSEKSSYASRKGDESLKSGLQMGLFHWGADIVLLGAILFIFSQVGSLEYRDFFRSFSQGAWSSGALSLVGLLLLLASLAKMGQFPFISWMKGLVGRSLSATSLIVLGATGLAGIYISLRFFPFLAGYSFLSGDHFSSDVLWFMAFLGGVTGILGALMALWAEKLSRLLGYAALSQMGYALVGIGVGALMAGFFYWLISTFLLILAFLAAGYIQRQGGSDRLAEWKEKLPPVKIVYYSLLMGLITLALLPVVFEFQAQKAILSSAVIYGLYHDQLRAFLPFLLGIITCLISLGYLFRVALLISAKDLEKKEEKEEVKTPIALQTVFILLMLVGLGATVFVRPLHKWGQGMIVNQSLHPTIHSKAHLVEKTIITQEIRLAQKRFSPPLFTGAMLGLAFLIFALAWFFLRGPKWAREYKLKGFMAQIQEFTRKEFYLGAFFNGFLLPSTIFVANFLYFFDRRSLETIFRGTARGTQTLGEICAKGEKKLVQKGVESSGEGILAAADTARRLETGKIQDYFYLSLVLMGFLIVLWAILIKYP